MRYSSRLAAAALLAGMAAPAPLLAHVGLAAATPASGSAGNAPGQITLTFDERVAPASASAAIIMTAMPGMADHGEMAIRNFVASWSADGTTLTLTLKKPLPKGTYDVRWQAAGDDGHVTRGTVTFAVR